MSDASATRDHDARHVPDPELLARIAHLRMAAARTVDGMLAGLHRSPHRGASMTFVEHRDYVPGDDLRLLDWRAYARNDRYVIRRFEQESQQAAYMALDVSASMSFGDAHTCKVDYAATLLAAVAYVLLRQGDAVGAFAWDAHVRHALAARQRPQHFDALLEILGQRPAAPTTSLQGALREQLDRVGRRALFVVASDLIDFETDALATLASMRGLGHEVILFHVLHRAELELQLEGAVRVEGLEQEPSIDVDAGALRQAYQQQVEIWLRGCEDSCRDHGVRYVRAITDQPAEAVLTQTLVDARRHGWA
jgi:uncharacterized protein (DUF58 family)